MLELFTPADGQGGVARVTIRREMGFIGCYDTQRTVGECQTSAAQKEITLQKVITLTANRIENRTGGTHAPVLAAEHGSSRKPRFTFRHKRGRDPTSRNQTPSHGFGATSPGFESTLSNELDVVP